MQVKPLYLEFFRFLDEWQEGDPWPLFDRLYLKPNEAFLSAYWKNFDHFDLEQITGRVRQMKKGDYSLLRSLVELQDPSVLTEEALERCRLAFPLDPQPPVYLFIGFFSADGITVEVDGAPSIALGLERFKDFKDLPLLVSHEYSHCAQHSLLKTLFPEGERTLLSAFLAEGLAVLFTQMVYPQIPLHRHLFLTPERLQWCRENQEVLLELAGADLASPKLVPVLFGPGDPDAGLPPRLGYFLARKMLGHCLSHHGAELFGKTSPAFEEFFRKVIDNQILPSGPEKE